MKRIPKKTLFLYNATVSYVDGDGKHTYYSQIWSETSEEAKRNIISIYELDIAHDVSDVEVIAELSENNPDFKWVKRFTIVNGELITEWNDDWGDDYE